MVWEEKDGEWMTGFPSGLGKEVLDGIKLDVGIFWMYDFLG